MQFDVEINGYGSVTLKKARRGRKEEEERCDQEILVRWEGS